MWHAISQDSFLATRLLARPLTKPFHAFPSCTISSAYILVKSFLSYSHEIIHHLLGLPALPCITTVTHVIFFTGLIRSIFLTCLYLLKTISLTTLYFFLTLHKPLIISIFYSIIPSWSPLDLLYPSLIIYLQWPYFLLFFLLITPTLPYTIKVGTIMVSCSNVATLNSKLLWSLSPLLHPLISYIA